MLGSDGSIEYDQAVIEDMTVFSECVGNLISKLKQLYDMYELDMPPKVQLY